MFFNLCQLYIEYLLTGVFNTNTLQWNNETDADNRKHSTTKLNKLDITNNYLANVEKVYKIYYFEKSRGSERPHRTDLF